MNIHGNIAHVGHTQSPGDVQRSIQALQWCAENNIDFGRVVNDFVELRNGRDFLLEDREYVAVVLHYLFRGGFTIKKNGNGNKQLAYSARSSWVAWRNRLMLSGAKLIFAFGGMAEIGGSYIVSLDGYESIKVQEEFWVFKQYEFKT
jgi:hypothetical protein